jgi:dipeptidyl-peptidase-4
MATHLKPERVFASPPLTGSPPVDLRFTPDDKFVTFRAAAKDDRERFDLHRFELSTGEQSVWIDARTMSFTSSDITDLSAEERAERERRRDFSHGITSYLWRPKHTGQLLLPINGQAYLLDTTTNEQTPKAICPANTRQNGFHFSNDGQWLSYVRERNLYVHEIETGAEQCLTQTQSEQETFGLPDFLAAEEMHRFDGHWWLENGSALLYSRVDESAVDVSYRMEMDATGARTIPQRYPYAGATNPLVELHYVDLQSQQQRCLWSSANEDQYLARVLPMLDGILILVQDRQQQSLEYLWQAANEVPSADQWQELYRERSTTWVNLTDDTRAHQDRILVTDESKGHRSLCLVDLNGEVTSLPGPTHINRVVSNDDRFIYVLGWQNTATENHLFRIDSADPSVTQLTHTPGWHEVTINSPSTHYIDRFTNLETLLRISYKDLSADDSRLLHEENIDENHPYQPFVQNHAHARLGAIEADDGQTLHYRLTPPSEINGTHATIVYVYGGPGAQKVRNDWGTLTVQVFAQNGFGVLELDNRGSANRGRIFESPLYKNMGLIEVQDQLRGLTVLAETDWADLERVGIFGHSYGGYMTMMSLCQAPQSFAAGVAVAPVCDWSLYDSHYTERFMGDPNTNKEAYTASNVLSYLSALDSPLLLMHGMADDNVQFTNSTMIMSRLQELGKPFQLMTYPGAKHSMQEPHVSIHRFNMILNFFNEQLG